MPYVYRVVYCAKNLSKLYKRIGDQAKHLQAVEFTAEALYESKKYDEARQWYEKFHDLSTAAGHRDGAAIALLQQGNCYDYTRKHVDAHTKFSEFLSLADKMNSKSLQAKANSDKEFSQSDEPEFSSTITGSENSITRSCILVVDLILSVKTFT